MARKKVDKHFHDASHLIGHILEGLEQTSPFRARCVSNPVRKMKKTKTIQKSSSSHALDSPNEVHKLLRKLPQNERHLLRQSWRHLKQNSNRSVQIMISVFEKTVEKDRRVREMFRKNDELLKRSKGITLANHAKQLADHIDAIIDPVVASKMDLQQTGKSHGLLYWSGFRPEFWEAFGQSFSEVINRKDTLSPAIAAKAWNVLIAILTDQLRACYEQEVKMQKIKPIGDLASGFSRSSEQFDVLAVPKPGRRLRRTSSCSNMEEINRFCSTMV